MSAPPLPTARILGALALWVVVVAAGSWLVWTVIATVGEDAGADLAVPARTEPGDAGVGPGDEATPSAPREGPSATPTRESVPTTDTEPTAAPRPTEPRPSEQRPSEPTSAAGPTTRTLTWSGAAGTVTTRCTGSRIELAGASASADGYVVEVDDRGPDRVRVEFEGRGDETVPETRVEAHCAAGRPSYDVTTER